MYGWIGEAKPFVLKSETRNEWKIGVLDTSTGDCYVLSIIYFNENAAIKAANETAKSCSNGKQILNMRGNRYGSQGWDLYSNHKIPAGWILVYGNIHSEEPEAPIRREIMKLYRTHIQLPHPIEGGACD